ncbi:type IV toxin-antitoxin system AbiEi family antitoxin domain-containing protein [Blastococcus saxobsidens]|uniref:AbiEi antitoxin N-terminal domain-containing protein n=1 Tax=Blastococcus saxobsidens (strain DD2) TaxID=1146883 RepID=H6RRJ5_BLASD|nr:type IV toxin-antitoxin system AbiEi family antitoxin domain-containing protein [Blastococcus saxobsidens]CCG05477.1 conserved protein of unknown function [Blastococcus saxobsidens DD2]
MHPLLRAVAERQHGLFTAVDAHRAGYAHAEIRHLCNSGRWHRLRRGIYVGAETLDGVDGDHRHLLDCVAVFLALDRPAAALSHHTAARLMGLPVRRRRDAVVRLTDPAHGRTGQGFVVSRGPLDPSEISIREPLRLTAPARTLVDCAREWPLEDAVVAMDAALLADRTTREQLVDAVARARGWPGAPRAGRALSLADGRAESPLETRGRLRMVGAGLPQPVLQVEIRTGGRFVGVVDAWFDDAAVAVEFDGRVKYTDPWRDPARVLWEEKRREDELRALDIAVVRIADADLGPGWPAVEERLGRLLSRRPPAVRRFCAVPRRRGVARVR